LSAYRCSNMDLDKIKREMR
jgi:hypothetical protein